MSDTLQAPRAAARSRHRIAVVVLDGTFVLDLAIAIQAFGLRPSVFQKLRDEPESPYDIVVCGNPTVTTTALGFTISDLHPFEQIASADTILVPGLDTADVPAPTEVLEAIAEAGRLGKRLVSLCAGAFVLGHAGVLDGHRVTTHWLMAEEFRALFPEVDLVEEELYVDDGQVLTSGGMLAAADLCLHILRQDCGQAYANDVSRLFISPPHRAGGQSQYFKAPVHPVPSSLAEVMAWIEEHLGDPLSLQVVARHAHVSERTLARQFREEAGTSLMQWVGHRRVERARALLEDSDLSVSQVGYATGFGSAETLRRQFARMTGTTPGAYRATFRHNGTA